MERLTTNKDVQEMGMVELAHNSCYVKDRAAWYRDFSSDMDARGLARKLLKDFAEGDDSFTCDEYIAACLEDGMDSVEGLIALFYRNLWAMADLHTRLKRYEDLQEQGRLPELPCAVGDMTYHASNLDRRVIDAIVQRIEIDADGFWVITSSGTHSFDDFDKTMFTVKESAEAALKEMGG